MDERLYRPLYPAALALDPAFQHTAHGKSYRRVEPLLASCFDLIKRTILEDGMGKMVLRV